MEDEADEGLTGCVDADDVVPPLFNPLLVLVGFDPEAAIVDFPLDEVKVEDAEADAGPSVDDGLVLTALPDRAVDREKLIRNGECSLS